MFGLGFGEMIVLGIVLLVVVGPRELPKMLRSLGRGINKLRRMSTDLRQQSGIDDILHEEGLREDLEAIRSLSKGRLLEGAINAASKPSPRRAPARTQPRSNAPGVEELAPPEAGAPPPRDKEWPAVGCDSYGALSDDEEPALPTGDEASDEAASPEEEDISHEQDDEAADPYAGADAAVGEPKAAATRSERAANADDPAKGAGSDAAKPTEEETA